MEGNEELTSNRIPSESGAIYYFNIFEKHNIYNQIVWIPIESNCEGSEKVIIEPRLSSLAAKPKILN